MTSYLSSLSSHYTSLKRLLPTSLSSDSDNHITDPADSHVSRVLRAYYTEKGRPFPPWLGADPNAPVKAPPAFVTQPPNRNSAPPPGNSLRGQRGGGGLDDLFNPQQDQPAQQQEEPLSLRAKRGVRSPAPTRDGGLKPPPQPTARPLPSQRLGSYQNRGNDTSIYNGSSLPIQSGKEQSAQDRLRARFGGSRNASPVPSPSPSTGYDNPTSTSRSGGGSSNSYDGSGGGSRFNPYETGGGGGGGGGGFNPYEIPSSGGRRNAYASPTDDSYSKAGGEAGGRQKPYTSASSPWVTGDDGGFGYGGDLGSGAARRGPGLPSNPKSRR